MPSKFCLIGSLAKDFKEKLRSGEIDPEKLHKMTSVERHEYFATFLGKDTAKNVNALFEKNILSKNFWDGITKWAKEVTGIKPDVRRDLIAKIESMRNNKAGNLLSPEEEENFLQDLASSKLGVDVSFEEAKKISELSALAEKAKIDAGDFTDYSKRIEYGKKLIDVYEYTGSLKPSKGFIDQAVDIANIPRALMSTLDLSAPFRQGFGMVGRKNFWLNLKPMVRAAFKEEAFKEIQADIITRANYQSMKRSGLRLTGLGDKLTDREEQFMTTFLDKIPGIRGSERAYTGFLSKLRADMYDDFIRKADLMGENIQPGSQATKDLADVVNNFTGAGKLGKADQTVPILNALFFSPRKIAAAMQKLNPQKYIDPRISKTARQEAIKSLLGMVGISSTVLTLAGMAGAKIETDPRSSDFGKVQIGNTRFDVTGGDGGYAVLLARLISGKTKSTTSDIITGLGEGFGSQTRGDTLVKFFRNKLSPTASFFADWLYGTDVIGNAFDIKKETLNRITPMIIGTAIQTVAEDKSMVVPSALADLVGIGVNTYSSNVDWNNSTGKELQQFKEKVGQDKFDQANQEYNVEVVKKIAELQKNDRYLNLSPEEQLKVIVRDKGEIKDNIYKKHGFHYRKPAIKKLPNI